MNIYYIEITDLFGGELNYSWVRRFYTTAKSQRGAIQLVARYYGGKWRQQSGDSDSMVYHSGGCGCVVDWIAEDELKDKQEHYTIEQL